jgi:response regulator NasT
VSNTEVKPTEGDADEPTPAKKPAAARKAANPAKSAAGEASGPDEKPAAPRRATAANKTSAADAGASAQTADKPVAARRATAAPRKAPAAKATPAEGAAPVEPSAARSAASTSSPGPAAAAPTSETPTSETPTSETPASEAPTPEAAAGKPSATRTTAVKAPATAPEDPPPAILPELPAAKAGDQRREYKGTGRRVVVAEDEALIRLDVVETLSEAGFDVVGEAGDGEKAVALATELRPDVVVMDIKMPILDGISAAERIGAARIAPVVLLTAFSQAELVERARDAGAMAYVVKPFTPAELLPAIEIAIARHQEITALESEVADLAERFETRKRVERAKGLLQSKMGLTEPESFRWIQKTSMDRRLTMREVADAVIDQVGNGDKAR